MERKDSWKHQMTFQEDQIYRCAETGDFYTLKSLLQAGHPINFLNPITTDSPLMAACRRGHDQIVDLCLQYGARNDPHPDFGQTALHAAVAAGQYNCASIILQVAHQSEADSIITNLTDQNGQTPLHVSSTLGSIPLVKLLLKHGAHLSSIDSHGQTALHLAAAAGHEPCLALLLDEGGDEIIESGDIHGNSPLHHAAYNGRLECAKLLLETAANSITRNSKGLTPYNLAITQGHQQVGLLLLEYRDINAFKSTQTTPAMKTPLARRVSPFSPTDSLASRLSTPSTRFDDSEYKTPNLANRYEVALSIKDISPSTPLAKDSNFSKSLAVKEPQMLSESLPRPHTLNSLNSPAFNNKKPTSKKNNSNSSSLGSPVELIRETSNNSYNSDNFVQSKPVLGYSNFESLSQLSTPLLSRDTSSISRPSLEDNHSKNQVATSNELYQNQDFQSHEYYEAYYQDDNQYSTNNEYTNQDYDDQFSSQIDEYSIPYPNQTENVLSTPQRKEYNVNVEEAEETVYAEPIEIFDYEHSSWHVYYLEDGHSIYYLNMETYHSQWEDPRVYGVIDSNNFVDLPPDSPSKLSDGVPPPASPAVIKGPNLLSPGINRLCRSEATSTREAVKLFDFDIDIPEAKNSEKNSRSISSDSSSSDESDVEIQDLKQIRLISKKREIKDSSSVRFKATVGVPAALQLEKAASKEDIEISENTKRLPLSKPAFSKNSWIKSDSDQENGQQKIIESLEPISNVKGKDSNRPQISTIDEMINPDDCMYYVQMINEGKFNLQEIRTLLEKENKSSKFILKVLSMADDILVLDENLANPENNKLSESSNKIEQPTKVSSSSSSKNDLELLKDDPLFGKYVKMTKMGVPGMSVITKMKIDGHPQAVIERMQRALGLIEDVEKVPESSSSKWQPVPEDRLKNSIWAFATLGSTDQGNVLVADQELKELEQLFLSKPKQEAKVIEINKKNIPTLKLLESKRAQNVIIGLVAFKSIGSHLDIIKSICSLDTLGNLLSADNLENFKHLLPTDAEVKKSFLLKNVNHPAELFIQASLLFYPELPVRLNTFIICLGFNEFTNQLENRFRVIMDTINQVLSSPKLAKILQKLLIVGRVMMEPGGKQRLVPASTSEPSTVLDQLLHVGSTKSVDKKTNVLDYVVKTLYDKSEESLLGVIEDLSLLADNTLPLSSMEAIQEYSNLEQQLAKLTKELQRSQPMAESETLTSPTAKSMSDKYCHRLSDYIHEFKEKMGYLNKRKIILSKKLKSLMEYFGEEPSNQDTNKIFNALKEFRRALAFSKESVEWKLSRNNNS